jgi:hypothetical protein
LSILARSWRRAAGKKVSGYVKPGVTRRTLLKLKANKDVAKALEEVTLHRPENEHCGDLLSIGLIFQPSDPRPH